jgi:hypothetical protein
MKNKTKRIIIDDDSDIISGPSTSLPDILKDTEIHLEETCEEDSGFDDPHEHEEK